MGDLRDVGVATSDHVPQEEERAQVVQPCVASSCVRFGSEYLQCAPTAMAQQSSEMQRQCEAPFFYGAWWYTHRHIA